MDFIPHTDAERKEMLAVIGVNRFQDIVKDLPVYEKDIAIPSGLAEGEVIRLMHDLASKNLGGSRLLSFLGAGAYDHFSPAAIPAIISRGEFLTSYTPYQPEVSQGTLQSIYEFQSMVCEVMAMDVANAGMYEGASALAEAVLMALRETGRTDVLVPRSLHPDYRAVLNTYLAETSARIVEIPYKDGVLDIDFIAKNTSDQTAAVLVQNPNFFGIVEPAHEISKYTEAAGALFIACVNPLSLGILTPPGHYGADIAVAEGQPLGIATGYGGPYVGLFTCKTKWLRKMPGRLAGKTVDVDGRPAYVLTLQAREQHIRREKATSNVCTTTALIGLAATVYMALLGRQGFRDVAYQNLAKARYAFEQITQIPGIRPVFAPSAFFNEFAIHTKMPAETLQQALQAQGIVSGLPLKTWFPELEQASLWCVTETKTKGDIDRLVRALREAMQ